MGWDLDLSIPLRGLTQSPRPAPHQGKVVAAESEEPNKSQRNVKKWLQVQCLGKWASVTELQLDLGSCVCVSRICRSANSNCSSDSPLTLLCASEGHRPSRGRTWTPGPTYLSCQAGKAKRVRKPSPRRGERFTLLPSPGLECTPL